MRLNIACGPNVFPSQNWINYDHEDISGYLRELIDLKISDGMPAYQQRLTKYLQSGGKIDFRVKDVREGFAAEHGDGTVDAIYLGQMIEHLNPIYEAPMLVSECRRMLRAGGVLKITTPDLDLLVDAYKSGGMDKFVNDQPSFYKDADPSAQLAYLMYGACGERCTWDHYEGHMFLYTRSSISVLLSKAGFESPFKFYQEGGMSVDSIMADECFDAGMSHSLAVEAVAL